MKKIVLLIALISLSYFSFAQTKKLKEGVAEFNITYPSLTPEMKQMEGVLPKDMTIQFKNDQSRVEMSTPMGTTVVIGNNIKKDVTVLMDLMGQKIAFNQSQEELSKKEAELKKGGKIPEYTVIDSKETKVIAGYKCKKSVVQYTNDGKKEEMVCYYTEDLPKISSGTDNLALNEIKGFLMEYNISQNGIQMRVVAKSIKSKKVEDSVFLIPNDYKVMTQEEISDIMNGVGKNNNGK